MHTSKKIKVTEVNPHLICVLCRGYYIDATTIIECLHSFCKTCIVKYLQTNKYCPICDVQIHKTSPLLNIRSDKTLQNIVYKLVPSLFKSEMERRVKFYQEHPGHLPALPEERGEVTDCSAIILPEEVLVICMEYLCDKTPTDAIPKRYIHCPAEMTLGHLTRLIRGKFNLLPSHQVNIFFKNDLLPESLTVMEVVYTYQLRKKLPVHLFYRILELKRTTIRLLEVKERKEESRVPVKTAPSSEAATKEPMAEEKVARGEKRPSSGPVEGSALMEKGIVLEKTPTADRISQSNDNAENEWKEVQLQISENGVMSVRNMKSSECSPKPAVEAPAPTSQVNSPSVAQLSANMTPPVTQAAQTLASSTPTLQISRPATSSANGPLVSLPSELTTTIVPSNYTGPSRFPSTKPILSVSKVTKDQVKKDFNNVEANKLSISRVPAAGFKEKGEVLNKIVSKLSPNERVIGNTSVTIRPVLPAPPNAKTYHPPVSQTQPISQQNPHQQHHQLMNQPQPPNKILKVERKPQHTLRYKTLTSPTKQWNPSIDRTTMLSMKQNYDETKPPRFFKMRNLPRYLGNPASGVKPIFSSPQPSEEGSKDLKARSPSKLPPPFTPGSPKAGKSPYPDKTTWTPRVPSPAHSASMYNANPYLLYSGFPGSFNPDPSMLVNANPELVRSMFANAAYHPSLPPSINMLFNPLHNVPRSTMEATPSMQQRNPRTKSPSTKSEEKSDKPIPNLIPASISSPHSLPRSPTLPVSTMGIPTVPSIPPHPSHPPGSLLPLGASSLPPRLHPPMSVSSPIHLHNSMLLPSLPLHPSHHNLGSPRAHTSPVGSPRTSSPLHVSPPKSTAQPVYASLSRSPKHNQKPEQQKFSTAKPDKSLDAKTVPHTSSSHILAPTLHTSAPPVSTPVSQMTCSQTSASLHPSSPKPPPKTVLTSSSCQTTAIAPSAVSIAPVTSAPAAATPTISPGSPLPCTAKPAPAGSSDTVSEVPNKSSPPNKSEEKPSATAEPIECPLVKSSVPNYPGHSSSPSDTIQSSASATTSSTASTTTAATTTSIATTPAAALTTSTATTMSTVTTMSTASATSSAPEGKGRQETPKSSAVETQPLAENEIESPSKPPTSKSGEAPTKASSPITTKEKEETDTNREEKPKNEIRSDNNNISKNKEITGKNAVETAVSKEN